MISNYPPISTCLHDQQSDKLTTRQHYRIPVQFTKLPVVTKKNKYADAKIVFPFSLTMGGLNLEVFKVRFLPD